MLVSFLIIALPETKVIQMTGANSVSRIFQPGHGLNAEVGFYAMAYFKTFSQIVNLRL